MSKAIQDRILLRRLLLLDLATVVVMLPVASCAASGLFGTTPIPVLLVVDVSLCAGLGLLGMLAGFVLGLIPSRKNLGQCLVTYGAGLGAIFGATMVVLIAVRYLGGAAFFEEHG